MNEFNVGDNAVRVSGFTDKSPKGYVTKVLENDFYTDINGTKRDFWSHFWELVPEDIKPKWTIYNNTLPWSQLSDEQKGKLLLAAHGKMLFIGLGLQVTGIALVNSVYKVEEVAKPEPTMAEQFNADWRELSATLSVSEQMINKGWTKSCK